MPNGVKADELEDTGMSSGSLWGHLEYLEVNGVDQHQDGELVDGVLRHNISDTSFGLIGYPFVDDHSGLLCIFLRRIGNKPTHLCFQWASPLPHTAFHFIHQPFALSHRFPL